MFFFSLSLVFVKISPAAAQFRDIVVSVARKTDAAMWPALFAAVGAPSALLEGLLGAGALASAACCLLIVDRIEGPEPAHALALRLIRARRPARPRRRGVCVTGRTLLHNPTVAGRDPLRAWEGCDTGLQSFFAARWRPPSRCSSARARCSRAARGRASRNACAGDARQGLPADAGAGRELFGLAAEPLRELL